MSSSRFGTGPARVRPEPPRPPSPRALPPAYTAHTAPNMIADRPLVLPPQPVQQPSGFYRPGGSK